MENQLQMLAKQWQHHPILRVHFNSEFQRVCAKKGLSDATKPLNSDKTCAYCFSEVFKAKRFKTKVLAVCKVCKKTRRKALIEGQRPKVTKDQTTKSVSVKEVPTTKKVKRKKDENAGLILPIAKKKPSFDPNRLAKLLNKRRPEQDKLKQMLK